MQHKFKFLAAGAVAAAVGLTAFQVSAQVDPVARRKEIMKGFGAQNGTLSGMAQGRVPFDLARAKAALNVLAMGGNELPGPCEIRNSHPATRRRVLFSRFPCTSADFTPPVSRKRRSGPRPLLRLCATRKTASLATSESPG